MNSLHDYCQLEIARAEREIYHDKKTAQMTIEASRRIDFNRGVISAMKKLQRRIKEQSGNESFIENLSKK